MDAVTVDLSNSSRGVGTAGDAMGDTLTNIELVWGSMNNGDTFIAGPGADIIEGDGGSDTVSYEASELGVTVDLSSGLQHRTVVAGGAGTEEAPFMFHADDGQDGRLLPETVTQPTEGVPTILAMTGATLRLKTKTTIPTPTALEATNLAVSRT